MRVPEELIERIKNENDIVDVISEDVRLKKGGRNFMGLCPFHSEKSPSFSVSQEKQIYKCFGCGEAGNVISYVMKKRNLEFMDSVKLLAERANIPLDLGDGKVNRITKKKEELYKLNSLAGKYFFQNLQRSRVAKEYFLNRGIKEETMRMFGLGYALDGWQELINTMKRSGVNQNLLNEAGLISISEKGRAYDKFRNRVMFPVFDIKGKVIGFGGRVLDDSKPKYLNSPETMVFQKGTNLYALNFAIKKEMKERYFIIVEGYMDVISLHQYGITNAVASLGTALTENQARLLKRYADKVIISYDADVAGQTATLRGLEILRNAGLDVRVLQIPQGKDPDEFIRSNGKEAFLKLINNAMPLISYRLNRAKEGINFKDRESLIEYGNRVSIIISSLNPVEKDVYIKEVSEDTGIKEQSLFDLLKIRNNQREDSFMNKKEESGTKLYVEPGFIKAERSLIKLMLKDDYFNEIVSNLSKDDFNIDEHKKIFSLILKGNDENTSNIIAYIEGGLDDTETSKAWVNINEHEVLVGTDVERLIMDCIREVRNYKLKEKIEVLKKELKVLEKRGMIEESIKMVMELNELTEKLKKGERG